MVKLLRRLSTRLCDPIDVWEAFRRKDIGYFLFDDDKPTSSTLLKSIVNEVDKVFWDLNDIKRKLIQLEAQLCQNAQGVSHFRIENMNFVCGG